MNLSNKDQNLFIDMTKIQINDAIVRITDETAYLKKYAKA